MGIFVTAWNYLPIEAVCVWIAVSFQTVMVYEVVKRWKASGRKARHAFLGLAENKFPALPTVVSSTDQPTMMTLSLPGFSAIDHRARLTYSRQT